MTRLRTVVATLTVAVVATTASATAASATPLTAGATATAAAASIGTATLGANLQLSGSLGSFIDGLIGPIVTATLNPLVSALSGTVNSTVSGALGSFTASTTSNPGQAQALTAPAAFPSDPMPSPCSSTGTQPCASAAATTVSVPPLVTAQVGAMIGYVEQVASSADATAPVFARESVASTQVSVLSGITQIVPGLPSAVNPLISAGAMQSKANCPNDGASGASKPKTAPSASLAVTGVNLLGGLVRFDVASGQIANLAVNGTSYGSVLSLPTLTVSGVTVSPYGSAVLVSIPLTLAQALTALGITGSLATSLTGIALASTLVLNLVVGPNSAVTSRTASAWGLGVAADLSGSLTFNLLNLVTATVNVPTGLTGANYGNLLDLRLASTQCGSGVVLPAVVPVVPPGLV